MACKAAGKSSLSNSAHGEKSVWKQMIQLCLATNRECSGQTPTHAKKNFARRALFCVRPNFECLQYIRGNFFRLDVFIWLSQHVLTACNSLLQSILIGQRSITNVAVIRTQKHVSRRAQSQKRRPVQIAHFDCLEFMNTHRFRLLFLLTSWVFFPNNLMDDSFVGPFMEFHYVAAIERTACECRPQVVTEQRIKSS